MTKDLIATQLLHDLNVGFNLTVAERGRSLFPFLQPTYSVDRHFPLDERLVRAFNSLNTSDQQGVRDGVQEALARCAAQWLGLDRSLAVFDFHHAIAPEALSIGLMERLLSLNPDHNPEMRTAWLNRLLSRWEQNGISPDLAHALWLSAIRDASQSTLIPTLNYLVEGPLNKNVGAVTCLDEALRMTRQWIADGRLDADAIVDLPKAIIFLRDCVLPPEGVDLAKSETMWTAPSLSEQARLEAAELIRRLTQPGGAPASEHEAALELGLASNDALFGQQKAFL